MVITNQLKNQHLLWRAGFGPIPEDLSLFRQQSQKSLFKSMLKSSSKSPEYLDVADNMFKGLMMGIGEAGKLEKKDLSAGQKKDFRKQSQQDIKNLNLAWLNQMVSSEAQLREKMALFWHGHFASRNLNIFYQQLLLDIIRRNALGNFSELLFAVSKSAAMINFLNNNQNRKDHPNENFAREVMELFTMGRGNYTEQDVKEAARAFTGWGADLRGEFVFRYAQHDEGEKNFLGYKGNWDGDDILEILLKQKQTSVFITKKMYRFFVNDKIDEVRVNWLADRFYKNHYDIKRLMEDIFTAEWFYEADNIGTKIKSPVELIVGIRRMLPMDIENPESQLIVQRLLGQLLFYPPNVAGWPGGTSWIDSSSLMFRLKIPGMLYASDDFDLNPKADDDQMMGMREFPDANSKFKWKGKINSGQAIKVTIDWTPYFQQFDGIGKSELLSNIASVVLQQQSGANEKLLGKYLVTDSREQFVKSATIELMSLPEYQLC
jgi:uncharacterized protein DUF1800